MSCGETRNYEYVLSDDGVRGVSAEDETVVVLVEEKLPEDEIPDGKLARERIDADTKVVEVNDVSALDVRARLESPRRRYRPVRPGVSEMNASGGAATAGFMARVTDPSAAEIGLNADAGQVVRVSNQHVYGRSEQAEIGEPIVQPSPMDGDSNGTVGEYVGGSLLEDGSPADAAVRSVSESERRSQRAYMPHGIGPMKTGNGSVMRGDSVQKTGRTTGLTDGRVTATNATVDVSYGDAHENVRRRDVLVTTAQSKGGDSGAPLLTKPEDGRPALIGHVFSGSQRVSIADKLENIEEQLGVTALAAPEREPEEPPSDPGEGGGSPQDPGDRPDEGPNEPGVPSDRALINQVARAFEERYGSDSVLIEPRLKSGREPDIVVDTNLGVLMIEAEDDAESVLRESVSQALLYAGHSQNAIPMVVYPEGIDVPQPELGFLRAQSQVPFRAFPSDFPAF